MIIFNMRTPVDCINGNGVGVTGENLAVVQEFYIKGLTESLSYSLHLRFADGSVNSITPDLVESDENGTKIRWIVKKNDVFMHGCFELQIGGKNSSGLIFQTEIVTMYADESIPIEDKEYENPNSETLRLREEAYNALRTINEQQMKIEENLAEIKASDLSLKADKTELNEVKANIPELRSRMQSAETSIKQKANTSYVDERLAEKEDKSNKITDRRFITNTEENFPTIEYLESYYYKYFEIDDFLKNKYDASNIENGAGDFTLYGTAAEKISSASFQYQKIGEWINLHLYINLKQFDVSNGVSITLPGLPYVCKNLVTPREICVTSQKKELLWAIIPDTNAVTLLFKDTEKFFESEKLSFSIRYKIS